MDYVLTLRFTLFSPTKSNGRANWRANKIRAEWLDDQGVFLDGIYSIFLLFMKVFGQFSFKSEYGCFIDQSLTWLIVVPSNNQISVRRRIKDINWSANYFTFIHLLNSSICSTAYLVQNNCLLYEIDTFSTKKELSRETKCHMNTLLHIRKKCVSWLEKSENRNPNWFHLLWKSGLKHNHRVS